MSKRNKSLSRLYLISACVLLLCFVGCVVFIMQFFRSADKAEDSYENLRQDVSSVTQTDSSASSGTEAVTTLSAEEESAMALQQEMNALLPDKEISFQKLWETNMDIYAYIYIPGTNVDYPVLQHPSDDSFYLNHNVDMSKGYPGTIYTEKCNQTDFSDPVTLMYGHNMLNGSMFATLHNFEDPDFFDSNRHVFIYTPFETIVYEIFAAVTYSDEHIMKSYDFEKEEEFTRFLENVRSTRDLNAHFMEDIEVTCKDNVLVMSTCCSDSDKRFIVCAVKMGAVEK